MPLDNLNANVSYIGEIQGSRNQLRASIIKTLQNEADLHAQVADLENENDRLRIENALELKRIRHLETILSDINSGVSNASPSPSNRATQRSFVRDSVLADNFERYPRKNSDNVVDEDTNSGCNVISDDENDPSEASHLPSTPLSQATASVSSFLSH